MRRRVQNSEDKQDVKPSDERLGFTLLPILHGTKRERSRTSPKQAVVQSDSLKSACVEFAVSGSAACQCGQIEAQSFQKPLQQCTDKSSVVLTHREMHQSNRMSVCLRQISVHVKRQQSSRTTHWGYTVI